MGEAAAAPVKRRSRAADPPTRAEFTAPSVRYKPVESLVPYANNARTHSAEQIAQIKRSIVQFGWTNSILEDDRGVIAGHGRLIAATELYAEGATIYTPAKEPLPHGMVPVQDCNGWTDEERRAYILTDNQLAINAGWDDGLRASEIQALMAADFDVGVIGIEDADMTFLSGAGANFQPGSASGQSNLDQTAPIVCPSCGHEFRRT